MGMYDRDWYREERRQARQAAQHQPTTHQPKTNPKESSSGFTLVFVLITGLAVGYLLGGIF